MRHGKSFNHLSRKSAHRKALLANMAASLILNKRIETTTAKAKALRKYIEPLITKSKDDTTHSRRVVFSYLNDKYAVSELFREVSAKVGDRPGGYTRILKIGQRMGDNADMCIIELVDYNENMLAGSDDKKSKSRRRRGSSKKKDVDQTIESVQEVTEVEEIEAKDTPKEEVSKDNIEPEVVEPEELKETEAERTEEIIEEKAEVLEPNVEITEETIAEEEKPDTKAEDEKEDTKQGNEDTDKKSE